MCGADQCCPSADIFLSVVTSHTPLGHLMPNEPVSRILTVAFYCLTSSVYDDMQPPELESDSDLDVNVASASNNPHVYQHPAASMRKILSNGQFYFSTAFDLSSRLETRVRRGDKPGSVLGVFDERFLWNKFLVSSLLGFREGLTEAGRRTFDSQGFVVLAVQGFVGIFDLQLNPGPTPATLALISRLGCKRAGTRFNTRGIDDDGHVANFVETELVLRTPASVYSHVQIRGSIPLFWEQQTASLASPLSFTIPRVAITRPAIACQPAFDRHFDSLVEDYGKIEIVTLLGTREGESMLANGYREHLRASGLAEGSEAKVGMTEFDFHARTRLDGIEGVRELLRREPGVGGQLEKLGYCLVAYDAEKGDREVLVGQQGVFRVNCLDWCGGVPDYKRLNRE
jgi:hypothetical protein